MMRFAHGACAVLALAAAGCRSPYAADRGAALGAGTGAVLGAVVGNATGGSPLAGAAIGAAAGGLTGFAVGDAIDDAEARNRAEIEARMGRPVRAGALTVTDVVAMSKAGVADDLIVNHIRAHGMAAPLSSRDLIELTQQQVGPRVVAAMQEPPPAPAPTQVIVHEPPPMVVERHYWGPPRYPYHHHHHRHWGYRPGMSVGVTVRK